VLRSCRLPVGPTWLPPPWRRHLDRLEKGLTFPEFQELLADMDTLLRPLAPTAQVCCCRRAGWAALAGLSAPLPEGWNGGACGASVGWVGAWCVCVCEGDAAGAGFAIEACPIQQWAESWCVAPAPLVFVVGDTVRAVRGIGKLSA
jgi:hypothetical protein